MTENGGADANRRIRIFLSSPSDVLAEREVAEAVIRSVELAAEGRVRLEIIRWENQHYTAARTFQDQIPSPAECDLVVSIFWSRLGLELSAGYARPDGTPRTGSEYEFEVALDRARREQVPDILVYRRHALLSGLAPEELEDRNSQYRALEGFFSRWFRSEEGHFVAAYKQYGTPDEFATGFRRDLSDWLHKKLRSNAWDTVLRGSPFRGLQVYEPEHADIFFGRRRAERQALARLLATLTRGGAAFLLVIGASGSGKSSLMRAGLLPRLVSGGLPGAPSVRILTVKPGSEAADVFGGLARLLLEVMPELANGDFGTREALTSLLSGPPETAARVLASALRRWSDALIRQRGDAPPGVALIFFVDQLEEAVTVLRDHDREILFALLHKLSHTPGFLILGTLRGDYYGEIQVSAALVALKEEGATYDLAPPSERDIGEIIEEPARLAGLTYQRDEATGRDLAWELAHEANAPGALPLLSFTLGRLFELRDAASGQMQLVDYDRLGGLKGAIGEEAERVFLALRPAGIEEAHLRRVLRHLVREGEGQITAKPAALSDFPGDTPERRLIDAFTKARLFQVESDASSGARLRVSHEALLGSWPRAAALIAADRIDLARLRPVEAAEERWRERGKVTDLLIPSGLPLKEAESLDDAFRDDLAPGIRSYIEASRAADAARLEVDERRRAREVRFQRLTRRLAFAVSIAAVGVIVGAGLSLWLWNQANRQRALAEVQSKEALAARAEAVKQQQAAQSFAAEAASEAAAAEAARVEAEKQRSEALSQRDAAQKSSLEAAAASSKMLTLTGHTDAALALARKAIASARELGAGTIPVLIKEAALTAMIEDRYGPTLVLDAGEATKKIIADDEYGEVKMRSAFSADGTLVAIGLGHDVAVWRVSDGLRLGQLVVADEILDVQLVDDGHYLIVIANKKEDDGSDKASMTATILDVPAGRQKSYPLEKCIADLPCIRDGAPADRLVDIRKARDIAERLDRAATAEEESWLLQGGPMTLVGISQKRFHVFVADKTITVFDMEKQKAATKDTGRRSPVFAATAADAPVIAIGEFINGQADVLAIDVTNDVVDLKATESFELRGSAGIRAIALSDDGKTLFFENSRWGSNAQNGARLTAAMDIASKRELWSRTFEGGFLVGRGQHYAALSLGGQIEVINPRTSESLFSVEGSAEAFDPTRGVLLVSTPADRYRFRLVELLPLKKLAYEDRVPRGLRGSCDVESASFNALQDHPQRLWNETDWHRLPRPSIVSTRPTTDQNVFEFSLRLQKDGNFKLYRDEEHPGRATLTGSLSDLAGKFPALVKLLKQEGLMTLVAWSSLDRNWLITMSVKSGVRDGQPVQWVDWTAFEIRDGAILNLGSGRMDVDPNAGSAVRALSYVRPSFLGDLSAVAVPRTQCDWDVYALPSLAKKGSFRTAFANADYGTDVMRVEPISRDAFAVFSNDWYRVTRSIQILSYPELAQGPWLRFSEPDESDDDNHPDGVDTAREYERLTEAVFPSDAYFTADGADLLLRTEEGKIDAIGVPPWGKRLDALLAPP